MGGRLDPGGEMAVAMAEVLAGEGAYPEALGWLEIASERGPLGTAETARQREWIALARRDPTSTVPRQERRLTRPRLPYA